MRQPIKSFLRYLERGKSMKFSYEMTEWSKMVRKKLIDENMSVKDLAIAVGYHHCYIANLLNGTNKSKKAIAIICRYLGIEM
jgi:plasmid maintenance system antidote protein VapI